MNNIKKLLSIIPVLVCICILSLNAHAADNQGKNYLSDIRLYEGYGNVENKENLVKNFKSNQFEYSVIVPSNEIFVGAKLSQNAPKNSNMKVYFTAHMYGYTWPVEESISEDSVLDISTFLFDESVEGGLVKIKAGVEGNADEDIPEDTQTYMLYVHKEGTKSALLTTKLEALPEVSALALTDKDSVAEARTAYDELTDAQKELMAPSLIQKLTDSEEQIAKLEKAEEDKKQQTPTTGEDKKQQTSTTEPSNEVSVKKGAMFTVKGYKYKVTSNLVKNSTVTVVGYKNKKLSKISVPSSVKYKNVSFKVTTVGNKAFKNQKKAKTIVIGKNVKTIGKQAFAGDSNVKKITVKSAVLSKVESKAFSGINKKAVIKVPAKKLKSYKKIMKNKGQKKTVKITK